MRELLQSLSWADILILTVIGVCVFFAARYSARHKGTCGGDCTHCMQRCASKPEEKEN